jgi:hypothetical protein
LIGETLQPRLLATAAALAAGQIGAGQLRVISETMAAAIIDPSRRPLTDPLRR